MKPTSFSLLDFTAGHHQTRLDPASRVSSDPFFQRSMQNKVLNGLVYEICEIYIDDVLTHGKTDPGFLTNTR